MKRTITAAGLDRWGACQRGAGQVYSDEALAKLFAGRRGLTPLEVCDLEAVPVVDRIWVLLRQDVLGGDGFRAVLTVIVTRAIDRGVCVLRGVRAPWAVAWCRWAAWWLSNRDRSEAGARWAKGVAMTEFPDPAALVAAWSSAAAVAGATEAWPLVASRAAAEAAAWADVASPDAARAAERRQQLADIRSELVRQARS